MRLLFVYSSYIFSLFFTDILVSGSGPYGQCDGGGDQPVEVRVGSSSVCTFLQEPPLYSGNVPSFFFFDLYLLFGFRLFTLFFVPFCRRLLGVLGPTTRVPRAGDTVVAREREHNTRPYGIAVLTRG